MLLVGRVRLQPPQHLEAVDVGEDEVEDDHVRLQSRQPQGVAPGCRLAAPGQDAEPAERVTGAADPARAWSPGG
jgi:hypothetical protein